MRSLGDIGSYDPNTPGPSFLRILKQSTRWLTRSLAAMDFHILLGGPQVSLE